MMEDAISMPAAMAALYEQMDMNLREKLYPNSITDIQACILLVKDAMTALKAYVMENGFTDKQSEIHFFKTIKPLFYSRLLYYIKLYHLQIALPPVGKQGHIHYFEKALDKINHYFYCNRDFYQYYRRGADHLDSIYFLRGTTQPGNSLNPYYFDMDCSFSTSHDRVVARIIANELLVVHLERQLGLPGGRIAQESANMPVLQWTGSRVGLVELIYSLHAAEVFNNGKVEIKTIAACFEQLFKIELGNYYHAFNEIRLRKKSRTQMLDQLRERVIRKMDEMDEK